MRLAGSRFHEVFLHCHARGIIHRPQEQMPYGLAEFEIVDSDGYVLCLSQAVPDAADLPRPGEAKSG